MGDTKKPEGLKKIGIYVGVAALGDFLFIVPTFRAFRKAYPDAKIFFIGKILHKYVLPIFDNCPYIDGVIEFHLYEKKSVPAYAKFVSRLRREKFDLLVDTQRKFVPSLLMKMAGPRYMVSYSSKGVFSDFEVPDEDRDKRHTSDISLDLARAVGIEDPERELEISPDEENRRYAAEFITGQGLDDVPLVGFIPNAGFPTRRWDSAKFAQLADRLSNENSYRVILFGAKNDKPVMDEIAEAATTPLIYEDFTRKSILDSAALMEKCDVIVGVDTGPLHLADALGKSCVGIYGPTLPSRFGLIGKNCVEICRYEDCAPCSILDCEHRKCINNITVEEVYDVVAELLSKERNG